MGQRLRNFATRALSPLFLATLLLWCRSFWVADSIWWGSTPQLTSTGSWKTVHWELRLDYGGIYAEHAIHESKSAAYAASFAASGTEIGGFVWSNIDTVLGFAFKHEDVQGGFINYQLTYVTVSLWLPFALVALPAYVRYLRRLHRDRLIQIRIGQCQCQTCSYNLTGNTSRTCPECGTPVPSNPEVIA